MERLLKPPVYVFNPTTNRVAGTVHLTGFAGTSTYISFGQQWIEK